MHMHHDPLRLDGLTCACTALRKVSRAVTRWYDDVLAGTGMTLGQFTLLRNIARNEPVPLMQLADMLVMDRTSLYRALKPLERDGWVLVVDGKGRSKTARLTDEGRKAMLGETDAWERVQERLLGRIGREAWTGIEGSLAQLVAIASAEVQ